MRKYFDKIDGLRFVAIAFVLIEHFAHDIGQNISAGYYGVDLFFVISGFLITNILLKSKGSFKQAYTKFIGRRTLRIFPIYYLTIAVLLIVSYDTYKHDALYLLTYTFNYAWVYFDIENNSLSHFWSLAVEEQFYLFWPFLIIPLKNNAKALFWIIFGICVISFAQLSYNIFESVTPYNYVGLFPRAGSLCVGAIGALLFHKNKLPDSFFNSTVVELFFVALLIVSLTTVFRLKEPVLALCSLYFVLKSVHSDFSFSQINTFLTHKRVLQIGRISYGIYVYHIPIGFYLSNSFILPWWESIDFTAFGMFSFIGSLLWVFILPLYTVLTIIVAWLSNKYIEQPILKLKSKYFS
ncbi:MAG: acyltransferase family protein [Bacteroidota bacterium]